MDKEVQQENWVPILKVIENMELYGVHSMKDLEVAYRPDVKSIEISGEKPILMPSGLIRKTTGVGKTQYFETDTTIKWYPSIYRGRLYLVSDRPMATPIYLKGRAGLYFCQKILEDIVHLHDCSLLQARAVTDAKEREKLFLFAYPPEVDRKNTLWALIGRRQEEAVVRECSYNDGVVGTYTRELAQIWASGYIDELTERFEIFHFISLPKNIFVDISKLGKEPLPMKRGVITGISTDTKNKLRDIATGRIAEDGPMLAEALLKVIEAIEGQMD